MTEREQWWGDYWLALEGYVRGAPEFYTADACAIEYANEQARRRLNPEPAREDPGDG